MLAQSFRLQKKDIARLYKKGKTFREDFLFLRFMPNLTNNSRFSVVISKTVAGKATARNRLKRKTNEILFGLIKDIGNKNMDVMISFKGLPEEKDIKPVLEKVFKKIWVL